MRHVVEGMVMLTNDDTVTAAALPEEIALSVAATGREPGVSAESAAVRDLDAVERDAIRTAIARRQGNLTMVANDLRISKSTLYLKIDKYGLNPILRQARQHDRQTSLGTHRPDIGRRPNIGRGSEVPPFAPSCSFV